MLSETHFPFLAEKGHVISLVGGTRFYELPITPEQVAMAVEENR